MPKNYRPVTLTSHIVKIFESFAVDKLEGYIDEAVNMDLDVIGHASPICCSTITGSWEYWRVALWLTWFTSTSQIHLTKWTTVS